jgi:hypothetical protein
MKTRYTIALFILFIILFPCISYQIVAYVWRSSYDEESHDCRKMSYELGNFLQKLGLPVKIMYGNHEDPNGKITDAHVWVLIADCIQVDAVNLEVCDNTNYYSHYHIENVQDATIRAKV